MAYLSYASKSDVFLVEFHQSNYRIHDNTCCDNEVSLPLRSTRMKGRIAQQQQREWYEETTIATRLIDAVSIRRSTEKLI